MTDMGNPFHNGLWGIMFIIKTTIEIYDEHNRATITFKL